MSKFPFYKQLDAMDCGPTCLRMIAKFYGKTFSVQQLREQSYIQRTGVNLLGISEAAKMKSILTEEQFEKWQEMQGRYKDHGKMQKGDGKGAYRDGKKHK